LKKLLSFILLFYIQSSYSLEGSFEIKFQCSRSTETLNEKSIIPYDGHVQINYKFNKELKSFEVTYPIFDEFIKENADLAVQCISTNSNRLFRELFDTCTEQTEDYELCNQSVLKANDDFEEKFKIDFSKYRKTMFPGEYTQGNLTKFAKGLSDNCGKFNWRAEYFTQTFMKNQLPSVMDNADDECKRNIIKAYQARYDDLVSDLDRLESPQTKTRMQNGLTTSLDLMNEIINQYYTLDLGKNFTHYQCRETIESKLNYLSVFSDELEDQIMCMELKPGNENARILDTSGVNSHSNIEQRYKLSRDGNTYKVGLDLDFYSNNEEITNEVKMRLNICLERVNKLMKGPNGKRMEIYLHDPKQASGNPPPPVAIDLIDDVYHRSHSRAWNSHIDCKTMTHELLHLMGLCDEYPETSKGYIYNENTGQREFVENGAEFKAYDCRSIGPEDSIMRNQNNAFNNVEPSNILILCNAAMGNNENGECNGTELFYPSDSPEFESMRKEAEFHNIPIRVAVNKPTSNSLLSPEQFKIITRPGCRKVNNNYYTCSQDAYTTSSAVSGVEGVSCIDKPDNCTKGNTSWISVK
jgi:hypothetical protein